MEQRLCSWRNRALLNRGQVSHQGIDRSGVLGLPGLNFRLADLRNLD